MAAKKGKSSGSLLLDWRIVLFFTLVGAWIAYSFKARWVYRIGVVLFSRFVGLVAFQYNRDFRHAFASDFDLREPPNAVSSNFSLTERRKSKEKYTYNVTEMVNYSINEFLVRHKKLPYNIKNTPDNDVTQRLACYIDEYQDDVIKDNACYKMIDVDYFVDLEFWLTSMKPILMYSFVPSGVGGVLSNGTYSAQNNIFSIVYDDGNKVEYELWDYGYEYLTIETCWGVVICPISQLKIPEEPNYRVISIVPATFVPVPFSMLVQRREIQRLRVTYGKENVLRVQDAPGREYISMAPEGSNVDYTVPGELFDILKLREEYSKVRIRTIEKFLKREGVPKEYISGTLVYEILHNKEYPPKPPKRTQKIIHCEEARYLKPRKFTLRRKAKYALVKPKITSRSDPCTGLTVSQDREKQKIEYVEIEKD